jgi:1-acyl-sn-glycerol-3-phosphate acyltransferase
MRYHKRVNAPPLGAAVPQRGNRFSRWLGRLLLGLAGWKFEGNTPNLPRFVAILAPHTSNWDFVLFVLGFMALGINMSWMGKHTLFHGPSGRLFLKLGGVPIDRRAPKGVVDQMVDEFARRRQFILGIAPEGTRSKVTRWKMGFYHIAAGAGVPIVPVALDYGRREVRIGQELLPTGDADEDLARLRAFYADVVAKNPHFA